MSADTSNHFHIENANWRDLNAVRQLERVCFPKDAWPLWDIIGVLTLPNVVRLKAIQGEELIGFIVGDIRRSQNLALIATIGVLPRYRRQGVAAALLEACEKRLPVGTVRLNVRTSNQVAIELYNHHGYREVGTWPRYYSDGEDALIFEKAL